MLLWPKISIVLIHVLGLSEYSFSLSVTEPALEKRGRVRQKILKDPKQVQIHVYNPTITSRELCPNDKHVPITLTLVYKPLYGE